MKKFFLALVAAALANTAWAQPAPTTPTTGVQPIEQVSHGRILGCDKPNCNPCPTACCKPCPTACCKPCPTPCVATTKTICVPQPGTVVHKTICYGKICDHVCFPRCSFSGLFGGGCCNTGCDQTNCGHPYQRNYLVKRVTITECPTTVCVPVTVPACETRGGILHRHSGVAPAPVEAVPAPPKKMP